MLSKKQIEKLLQGVFNGEISLFNLPTEIFKFTYSELIKVVDAGFGGGVGDFAEGTIRDIVARNSRQNIFTFSGAKTFNEVKDLSLFVFNEDGTKRTFKEFREFGQAINQQYNVDWLKTEQDTAFGMAQSKDKWIDIEEDKELFPMLTYETVGDGRVRDEHAAWDGLTFPVDHEFWDTRMPINDWNCYDKETSIYTDEGWKLFSELNKTEKVLTLNPETKDLEWQKPITYIDYHHNGNMINIEANNMSVCVTPNHNMLVRKSWDRHKKRETLKLVKSNEIASGDEIYRASKWTGINNNGINIGSKFIDIETYVKFMAWYLADGSITKRKGTNSYQIKIAQNKGKLYDRLAKDIKNMPINIYFGNDYIGFNNTEIGKYLLQFGKCNEKYVPAEIKNLPVDKIRMFLDIYAITDGYVQKKEGRKTIYQYYTSSKKLADDLSELIIKAGKACSMSLSSIKGTTTKFRNGIYTSNYDVYKVSELNSVYFNLDKKRNISTIKYNNNVYCVEIPKYNTLLVSRRGKIYWSGNCRCTVSKHEDGKTSSLKGVPKNESKMFSNNPGKVDYIFNPKVHPYYKVEKRFKPMLKDNFGFKMPEK